MSLQIIYWIYLTLCSAYVLWRGGSPERVAICMMIVASFFSMILTSHDIRVRYQHMETGVFYVDLVLFAAFVLLALWSDRFWPLWITGFHLVGVATHTAKLVDPAVFPGVYSWISGLWSYPILLFIVIGAARHQKRLRHFGADSSWNASFVAVGRKWRRFGPNG